MGRLTTRLATAFAAADNVAFEETAQKISVLDALTSKRMVKWLVPEADKTKDTTAEQKHDRLFKITTDSKGRKSFIVHKGKKTEPPSKDDAKKKDKAIDGKKKLNEDKKNDKKQSDDKKEVPKPDDGANRGKDFTAEEDEKLKSMKADNKTWKEIMEALGRGKSELQARFKELQSGQPAAEDKDGKKAADKTDQQANDKQADDSKGKKKDKKGKAHDKKDGDDEEARFTMEEWLMLQEDDMFSFDELQCLSEIIAKLGNDNWAGVASKFFDVTGRRVSPEVIRDKFEQMGAMAK